MAQTIRDRIADYLSRHPEGATDTELTAALGIKYHAQTNERCHQLANAGLIERRRVGGVFRNFWRGDKEATQVCRLAPSEETSPGEPWYWEGNVQLSVVAFLKQRRYTIVHLANTRTRETGKDIEAQGDTGLLWVTVKGYPEGTPRTRPSTQAGHWFKDALFDIVSWRGDNRSAGLAMALPDYPRYRSLAARIQWLQPIVRFSFLWVGQDGTVTAEGEVV